MRLEDSIKLDYGDVLIRPKRSTLITRKEVNLWRNFTFKHSPVKYYGVPIIAANMDTIGTFEMARILHEQGMFTCIHKHYDIADWDDALILDTGPDPSIKSIAISTGISENDFTKTKTILSKFTEINYICVDVANGYTEAFVKFIRKIRKAYPEKVIIAGNVVTADMTEALILAGADIIKIGIGGGSVCTTRKKTGIGYPQLSAVIECADAAHGLAGHIIADGGCTCPGDVAKAFGAGADFVMLGSMLAGHKECGGEIISETGDNPYMEFYGMSSATAQEKHGDSLSGYRASEGKRVLIPYKGSVINTLQDILGGLRSTCTYTGSVKLKELSRRTTFIRVNNQTNDIYGATTEG